MKHIYSIKKV